MNSNKILRIGLLQLLSHEKDVSYNLYKGIKYCRKAKEDGCHIALFPEMWNIGYYEIAREDILHSIDGFKSRAISADSGFVQAYRNLARELDMVIALTYLEVEDSAEAPQGVMIVIDGGGEVVYKYAKVHTCDFDIGAIYKPGDDFPVMEVNTGIGPVMLGSMLCYDREFPETARILMLKGAEVILTANCCMLDDKRINQFQSRAFENAVAVAMANYPDPQTNGRSIAFDGSGDLIIEAGHQEEVCIADIDIDKLRAYRSTCGWGNAFRRPHKYSALVSHEIKAPFHRVTGLGEVFNPTMR